MFIDASAMVGILADEADSNALRGKVESAQQNYVSAICFYETALALIRLYGYSPALARNFVTEFIQVADAKFVPIDAEIGHLALEAFGRFGRERHRARLNMGDCFSYACAKVAGAKLLCKGDDFLHTDIALA